MRIFPANGGVAVQEDCGCKAVGTEFKACPEHEPKDTTEASLKEWQARKDRFLKAAEDAPLEWAKGGLIRQIIADHE